MTSADIEAAVLIAHGVGLRLVYPPNQINEASLVPTGELHLGGTASRCHACVGGVRWRYGTRVVDVVNDAIAEAIRFGVVKSPRAQRGELKQVLKELLAILDDKPCPSRTVRMTRLKK